MRLRRLASIVLATLVLPATAHAAVDPTTTAVSCTPSSPATGAAVTCTVTVTDTASSGASSPTGSVTVSTDEQVGGATTSNPCTLAAGGGASSSCTMTVTPTEGAADSVSAAYQGDGVNWGASSGTTSIDALDPTSVAVSCAPTTVVIGGATDCIATVTDIVGDADITGTVSFSVTPATGGTFSEPGACSMSVADPGATGSCPISFVPITAGTYAISASYAGDEAHQSSTSAPFSVTATTTPTTTGTTGSGSLSSGSSGGSTAATSQSWTVKVGPTARVSAKGVAAVSLSCAGPAGSICSGTLELSRIGPSTKKPGKHKKKKNKKKKKKKKKKLAERDALLRAVVAPSQRDSHKPKPGKGKPINRKTPKPKPVGPPRPTVVFGSGAYRLSPSATRTVSIHLSKRGLALLKAAKGKLTVTAIAEVEPVTLAGPVKLTLAGKRKPTKHPKGKKRKKGRKHASLRRRPPSPGD